MENPTFFLSSKAKEMAGSHQVHIPFGPKMTMGIFPMWGNTTCVFLFVMFPDGRPMYKGPFDQSPFLICPEDLEINGSPFGGPARENQKVESRV